MARFIHDEILDQIRLRADLVELVQSYVPNLRKAGTSSWKACCPFHTEKTPSFIVNAARQTYHCFGCGKGGNVFTFIMEMEKFDFPNAAEFLARKYGVIIPESAPGRRGEAFRSGTPDSEYQLRERLFLLHEKLAVWYAKNLSAGSVKSVCDYFQTRKIPSPFADRFQIGAAPDSWDAAIAFARAAGFTDRELRLSGVVSEKDEMPGRIYDRFRNRLMFPVWNEQGRVVAFSARSIEKDPKGWKYLNSPESPVFKKSRTLYALHLARVAIAEKKYAVLCEGQLDVIALHRAGCTGAVAAQGTAFGAEHAAILKRYTSEVRLAFDSDNAGKKAVFSAASLLLPLGFSVKVVRWPGGKDADELLKTSGPECLVQAVDSAVDFFEFALADALLLIPAGTPAGKARIASLLLEKIQLLDSAAARESYLMWLGGKLDLSASALRQDLEKRLETTLRRDALRLRRESAEQSQHSGTAGGELGKTSVVPFSERSAGLKEAFRDLLTLILEDESLALDAAHRIEEGMCDDTPLCRALDIVMRSALAGEWVNASQRILLEFARDGIDLSGISGLITAGLDGAAESPEDPPAAKMEEESTEDAEEKTPVPSEIPFKTDSGPGFSPGEPEDKAFPENSPFHLPDDEELPVNPETVRRQAVFNDCVRLIQREFCRICLDELAARARQVPDSDPEKLDLLRQIAEKSKILHSFSVRK